MVSGIEKISDIDWNELDFLRKEISFNPAAINPEQMERFSELFVETIRGCGDDPPYIMNTLNNENN
jgi:hypothetical protein